MSVEKPFPIIDKSKCTDCGICYEACPGVSVDFPGFNKELFNSKKIKPVGHFIEAYVGYSKDNFIRANSSSGGIVTSLLLCALDNRLINGALVVGSEKNRPWMPRPFLARNRKDVISAMQSKYSIVPTNMILQEIKNAKGTYATVGLPCHVHGIRKIKDKKIKDKIGFIIGIYGGFNASLDSIEFTLKKLGVNNFDDIKKVEHRGGEWPGGFKVTLRDGRTKFIEKFKHNFIFPLFLPNRCKLCMDLANDFSDISVGDAWIKNLMKIGKGWSLILVRTKRGKKILDLAKKQGHIEIKEVKMKEVLKSHKHTTKYKKENIFGRLWIYNKLGKATPNYGFDYSKKVTLRLISFESIFLLSLAIASKKTTRKLISFLPINLVGNFVSYIRKIITK